MNSYAASIASHRAANSPSATLDGDTSSSEEDVMSFIIAPLR
jgi:hypothetical protein